MKRAVALAPTLVVAACTLTTDLDGFSGGAPATDGGSPRDVANIPPGDGRAPPSDGGSGGGKEGGNDAGTPAVCPNEPVAVCEEFDSDETKNGWAVIQKNGASIAVATVPWGERGLLVTTPKTDTGDAPYANWEKKFDKTVSKMSFDIDLQFDQMPANSGEFHNTFAVHLDHGATYNVIYLSINPSVAGWAVQDFPDHPNNLDYRVVPLPPSQRHHVHFDIEAGGRSRFVVDGVTQADNPTPAYVLAGQPTLDVGVTVYGVPSTPMTMAFGHLVFTGE